jgi:hypothetical protein
VEFGGNSCCCGLYFFFLLKKHYEDYRIKNERHLTFHLNTNGTSTNCKAYRLLRKEKKKDYQARNKR